MTCILVWRKSERMPNIFCLLTPVTFRKKKNRIVKRTLTKISTFRKNTEDKYSHLAEVGNQRLQPEYSSLCRYVWRGRSHRFKSHNHQLRELAVLADTTDATIEGFVQN
jgi:isocitrate dehydrogenase